MKFLPLAPWFHTVTRMVSLRSKVDHLFFLGNFPEASHEIPIMACKALCHLIYHCSLPWEVIFLQILNSPAMWSLLRPGAQQALFHLCTCDPPFTSELCSLIIPVWLVPCLRVLGTLRFQPKHYISSHLALTNPRKEALPLFPTYIYLWT